MVSYGNVDESAACRINNKMPEVLSENKLKIRICIYLDRGKRIVGICCMNVYGSVSANDSPKERKNQLKSKKTFGKTVTKVNDKVERDHTHGRNFYAVVAVAVNRYSYSLRLHRSSLSPACSLSRSHENLLSF